MNLIKLAAAYQTPKQYLDSKNQTQSQGVNIPATQPITSVNRVIPAKPSTALVPVQSMQSKGIEQNRQAVYQEPQSTALVRQPTIPIKQIEPNRQVTNELQQGGNVIHVPPVQPQSTALVPVQQPVIQTKALEQNRQVTVQSAPVPVSVLPSQSTPIAQASNQGWIQPDQMKQVPIVRENRSPINTSSNSIQQPTSEPSSVAQPVSQNKGAWIQPSEMKQVPIVREGQAGVNTPKQQSKPQALPNNLKQSDVVSNMKEVPVVRENGKNTPNKTTVSTKAVTEKPQNVFDKTKANIDNFLSNNKQQKQQVNEPSPATEKPAQANKKTEAPKAVPPTQDQINESNKILQDRREQSNLYRYGNKDPNASANKKTEAPKTDTSAPKTEVPKAKASPTPGGFKSFLGDIQGDWSKKIEGQGSTIKNSLINLANTHLGADNKYTKHLANFTQQGGLFDKGVSLMAKHGLKAVGAVGAGMAAKGLLGVGKAVLSSPLAPAMIPVGLSLAGGVMKDMGMKNAGGIVADSGSTVKKILSKKASINYDLDGLTPIEDVFVSEKKASITGEALKIRNHGDLIKHMSPKLTPDQKEELFLAVNSLGDKEAKDRFLEGLMVAGGSIATGVFSNVLTDELRKKTGLNRPTIILATGKKTELLSGPPPTDSSGIHLNKNASTLSEVAKETEKGTKTLKKLFGSKNAIADILLKSGEFSKNNPLTASFLGGMTAATLGPGALDMGTRSVGSAFNYMNNQYNNLNYGFNNPYGYGGGGYGYGGNGYYGY